METLPGELHQLHAKLAEAAARSAPAVQGPACEASMARAAGSYSTTACSQACLGDPAWQTAAA